MIITDYDKNGEPTTIFEMRDWDKLERFCLDTVKQIDGLKKEIKSLREMMSR